MSFFSSLTSDALAIYAGELSHVLLLFLLLILPGWSLLDSPRVRSAMAVVPDGVPLLTVPATIVTIGVAFLLLQPMGAGVWLFRATGAALYGACILRLVWSPDARQRAIDDLRRYRWTVILPVLVALAAILYAGVGLHRFGEMEDWIRTANRNVHALPDDNRLSWFASETWRQHLRAGALFRTLWRIGDRGPLFALLHRFFAAAFESVPPTYANYTRLGVVLNSLVLVPLSLWCAALLQKTAARVVTLFVALNPWMFLNVYFTWPKMFGASFLISAVFILWRRPAPRSTMAFSVAGVLSGLAVLAHAGALLSMPVLYAVTCVRLIRSPRALVPSLLLPVMLVLVVLPWQIYKDRYAPETYNLFYMHYLDGKEYFSPLAHNVGRFLAEHPLREQVEVRRAHVEELAWRSIDPQLIAAFWRLEPVGRRVYDLEFFSPWYTVGLLWFSWIVVAVPVTGLARWTGLARRLEQLHLPLFSDLAKRSDVSLPATVAFIAISLTLNTALRWLPPHSHELPYTEIVLAATCILIVMARLGAAWLGLAAAAIVWRQYFYFVESARTSALRLPSLDVFGVLFWGTVAFAIVTALLGWPFERRVVISDAERQRSCSSS